MLGNGFGKRARIAGQNDVFGDEFKRNVVGAGVNQLDEAEVLQVGDFCRINLLLRKT